MKQASRIGFLRMAGISEGISFLVLLGIAMPLKYLFGYPIFTKVVGWIHGALFILYIIAVFGSIRPMRWKLTGVLIALAASLLPFGTFVLDRSWKKRKQELSNPNPGQTFP